MIVCFSGTGNSRHIADMLQDALGDELVRFPPGIMSNPERVKLNVEDDRIIWVMPVHSWGLPKVAGKVINEGKINSHKPLKHHLVITCGDDIGYADRQWRNAIRQRGWEPYSTFSVQMPNSYTFMKGFDVDKPEIASMKLAKAPERVKRIVEAISADEKTEDVVRGKFPWIKSKIIYPYFMHFCMSTKPFHATDACTGCARCALNCPITTIKMVNNRPSWGEHCLMCSRCYHSCPHHAVAYGKATNGKGQYLCPGYTLSKG